MWFKGLPFKQYAGPSSSLNCLGCCPINCSHIKGETNRTRRTESRGGEPSGDART